MKKEDLDAKDAEFEEEARKDEIMILNDRIIELETELRQALGKTSKSKSSELDTKILGLSTELLKSKQSLEQNNSKIQKFMEDSVRQIVGQKEQLESSWDIIKDLQD